MQIQAEIYQRGKNRGWTCLRNKHKQLQEKRKKNENKIRD